MWERKGRAWEWERERRRLGPRIERSMQTIQKLNIIDGHRDKMRRLKILKLDTIFLTDVIKYWAKFQSPRLSLRPKNQNCFKMKAPRTPLPGLPTLVWRYSEARVIFPSLFSESVLTKKLRERVSEFVSFRRVHMNVNKVCMCGCFVAEK